MEMQHFDSEELGHVQHPFFNHLIIAKFFSYVSYNDLKTCRLVCNFWKELVSPILSKKSAINLTEQRLSKYLSSFGSEALITTEDVYSVTNFHKCYHLHSLVIDPTTEDDTGRFIKSFFSSAEELHLSKCIFLNLEHCMEIFDLESLKTVSFNEVDICDGDEDKVLEKLSLREPSNIKRLEVTTCFQDDDQKGFPWEVIFQRVPQLQVLHAQVKTKQELSHVLSALMLTSPKLPITEFSCFLTDFDDAQLEILSAMKLQLTFLDLSVNVCDTTLSILLHSSKDTLEVLKLFRENHGGGSQRDRFKNQAIACSMKKLKYLELMGDCLQATTSLEFLKNTPMVETLSLYECNSKIIKNTPSSFRHSQLQSLSIESGYLAPRFLIKIGECFPNVSKISLFLDDDSLRTIFSALTNLEELTILGTDISDEGLTGVPLIALARNYKSMRDFRKFPFIGDCKKLRKVCLYPQPQDRITDYSVHHGLLHVKELTSVDLPETRITDAGIKALYKGAVNLTQLSARYYIDYDGALKTRRSKYQII